MGDWKDGAVFPHELKLTDAAEECAQWVVARPNYPSHPVLGFTIGYKVFCEVPISYTELTLIVTL